MTKQSDNTILTYDLGEMDTDAVCQVIQTSYWGKALSEEQIIKSFNFSSCVGLLHGGCQVGFARAVSDRATSAYLKDFFVVDAFQRRGFGRRLMQGLLNHPDLNEVPSWYLGTKDAHAFYETFGFKKSPEGIYMHLQL